MLRTCLILACAAALSACVPGRGGNPGDDDDDANNDPGLAGLDTNGDGVLTDADLDPGVGAVFLTRTGGDEDAEEGDSSTDAMLLPGDGGWGLRMESVGGLAMQLTMWFDDTNFDTFEPDPGEAELRSVSANAEGWLLWASSMEGSVTITESNESAASGYFEGSVELTVANSNETPTGEIITIEGFAFRDVAYALMQ